MVESHILITCRDCQKEFAADLEHCPNCGVKKPKKTSKFLLALLIIGVLAGLIQLGKTSEENDPHRTTQEQRNEAALMISSAGYNCGVVKTMTFLPNLNEFFATCERYSFTLENHGGRWTVKPHNF